MPLVTDIRPQKKLRYGEPRFNIYLDGKYSFSLPAEIFVKENLKIGQSLAEEKVTKLVKLDEFAKYYNLALKFFSLRPRSRKELKDWFRKKEVGESVQNLIWEKLKNLGYINDEEFIKWWVEQRQAFRPSGFNRIKLELLQKGVSRELVESIKQQVESKDELTLAKRAAEKKIRLWKNLQPMEFRQKMTAYLSRRGFSWEIIKDILALSEVEGVDEILKKE